MTLKVSTATGTVLAVACLPSKAFYCEKYLQNLRPIFFSFIYSVAIYLT